MKIMEFLSLGGYYKDLYGIQYKYLLIVLIQYIQSLICITILQQFLRRLTSMYKLKAQLVLIILNASQWDTKKTTYV